MQVWIRRPDKEEGVGLQGQVSVKGKVGGRRGGEEEGGRKEGGKSESNLEQLYTTTYDHATLLSTKY